jgi:hypothetical protein
MIGAACVDLEFRKLLLERPIEAARALGIVLTNFELDVLREALRKRRKRRGGSLEHAMEQVEVLICPPKKPCRFALVECVPPAVAGKKPGGPKLAITRKVAMARKAA